MKNEFDIFKSKNILITEGLCLSVRTSPLNLLVKK